MKLDLSKARAELVELLNLYHALEKVLKEKQEEIDRLMAINLKGQSDLQAEKIARQQ